MSVKLTNEDLSVISLFQRMTDAQVEDCIIMESDIVFLINSRDMGKAIGKKGINIKSASRVLRKNVIIVEHLQRVEDFLKNAFKRAEEKEISEIKVIDKNDKKVAVVKLGDAFGVKGKTLKILKILLERHFNIADIEIKHRL